MDFDAFVYQESCCQRKIAVVVKLKKHKRAGGRKRGRGNAHSRSNVLAHDPARGVVILRHSPQASGA
jgi:hypothetical protein